MADGPTNKQTNKQGKEGRTTTTKQRKKEQMKRTILPKQTIILQDIQNLAYLTNTSSSSVGSVMRQSQGLSYCVTETLSARPVEL
jgi:hypothetical protein